MYVSLFVFACGCACVYMYTHPLPPHNHSAPGQGVEPVRVLYSYFTAGTGGAGPTILETSMLLAGEDVIAYKYVVVGSCGGCDTGGVIGAAWPCMVNVTWSTHSGQWSTPNGAQPYT